MATTAKRTPTDWVEARDYWLALPKPRSSQTVADRYAVTRARVNFVRKRDNWDAAAEKLDAQLLRKATARIVRSRSERVEKVLGIVDGALDVFDEQLVEKARESRLRDMPELVKLGELLLGEATDRVSFGELQEALGVVIAIAVEYVPVERRPGFLEEVRGRLGEIGEAA